MQNRVSRFCQRLSYPGSTKAPKEGHRLKPNLLCGSLLFCYDEKMRNRLIALFLILFFPVQPLRACIWDRDTLKKEAKSHPDSLAIISGRFPRNPPEYYQIRLSRVKAEIRATAKVNLELFDDAGVAADRLHRGEEAISWMAEKRQLLEKFSDSKKHREQHLYRYHANLGTFLFHDWMRKGADSSRLSQAIDGRSHIAKAIEINPDAHFGREIYQLKAMDWIIDRKNGGKEPYFLTREEARDPKAIEGIEGLIHLGDAWNSADIFHNLGYAFRNQSDAHLALAAHRRAIEILNEGRPVFGFEKAIRSTRRGAIEEDSEMRIIKWFRKARTESDEWQEHRTRFMKSQFAKGLHPDVHKIFWDGYVEKGKPVAPVSINLSNSPYYIFYTLAILLVLIFIGKRIHNSYS